MGYKEIEMHLILNELADGGSVAANLMQDGTDEVIAEYLTPLRYQLGRCKSVKDVMGNRTTAVEEMENASITLHEKKRAYARARASAQTNGEALYNKAQGRAASAKKDISDAEEAIRSSEELIKFITHNLKSEVAKFDVEKRRDFRHLLIKHAELRARNAQVQREHWEALMQSLSGSYDVSTWNPENIEAPLNLDHTS